MKNNHVNECGAKTRGGAPCKKHPITGRKRCRLHGGRSTGPKTPEGLARMRAAKTKHGLFTAAGKAEKQKDRDYAAEIEEIACRTDVMMSYALRDAATRTPEERAALVDEFQAKHPQLFQRYFTGLNT